MRTTSEFEIEIKADKLLLARSDECVSRAAQMRQNREETLPIIWVDDLVVISDTGNSKLYFAVCLSPRYDSS